MKYDLFVFAGQSNMMGACVLPPKHKLNIKSCAEYKYKPVYLGKGSGVFVPVSYNCGEFLYKDIATAYSNTDEKGQSRMTDYAKNTYFASAMSNLVNEGEKTILPFTAYSESDRNTACSIVPYFCEEWEKLGQTALTAHIAKGGVSIDHFFSTGMAEEYNLFAAENGYRTIDTDGKAEEIYCRKCKVFFEDAEKTYGHDCTGEKILVWHQGESNSADTCEEYKKKLNILWDKAQTLGFDRFFIIRIGYWYTHDTCNVMRAQEEFCEENEKAYIISRDASFMPDPIYMDKIEDYYTEEPEQDYLFCRDAYYGYNNSHINEKGFIITAKTAAQNAYRILKENKNPILKRDIVKYE